MFGFRKKEKKPLKIWAKDVLEIIRSDYYEGMAFTMIEFLYNGKTYRIGSSVLPLNAEERKENIYFCFQDAVYTAFGEFTENSRIDGVRVSDLPQPIEVVKAGIVGPDVLLKTPWGENRLAAKALNRES